MVQYCLWSTLHHRFKQDLSKSVDKKYTVSMHVNVGWDLVYPREDSIDRPGSGFTTNPEWGQMLLLPLNLYTLLPLGTDDMMRSVWKYTCVWPLPVATSQFAWKMAFLISWGVAGLVAALESLLSWNFKTFMQKQSLFWNNYWQKTRLFTGFFQIFSNKH